MRDVTKPVVDCGAVVGAMPAVIRATATDACTAVVTLENVACATVVGATSTPLALADCPVAVAGDALQIDARLTDGVLEVRYDARAVDPSGNAEVVACVQTYGPDQDGDGVIDADDDCLSDPDSDQTDTDGDGAGDVCDVCPAVSDPDQADANGDGVGDVCSDLDADGVLDLDDNCELVPNTDQSDIDLDGTGDRCDDTSFDGLTAEGAGAACAGGTAAGLGALLGLLGVMLLRALSRARPRVR